MCCRAFGKGSGKTINVSVELLDSLLRDRSWVIESIVSGDIQNNPYAIANPSSTAECLLDEVLENYKIMLHLKHLWMRWMFMRIQAST